MAKISGLGLAGPLTGEELLEVVQGGVNKRVPMSQVATAGPQGPKGDTGEQGIQGVQGLQGPAGAVGPTGATGPKGDKGDKGDLGNTGPQGNNGVDGAQGPQGIQGFPGPQGDAGPTGPKGDKGDRGDTGIAPVAAATGVLTQATLTTAGQYLRFTNNNDPKYVFNPANVAFAAPMEFHGRNQSTANLELVATGAMVLNEPYGGSLFVPPKGTFTVKIVSATEADVFGVTLDPDELPVPDLTWHDPLDLAANVGLTGRINDGATWYGDSPVGYEAPLRGASFTEGVTAPTGFTFLCGNLVDVSKVQGAQYLRLTALWTRTAGGSNQILIKQANQELLGIQMSNSTGADARVAGNSAALQNLNQTGVTHYRAELLLQHGADSFTVELYNADTNTLLSSLTSTFTDWGSQLRYNKALSVTLAVGVGAASSTSMAVTDLLLTGSETAPAQA